jgi:DNA-binding CsgD family transcriptional regulator
LGDVDQAMATNLQALEIAERLGLRRLIGYIRAGLGQLIRDQGDNAEAARHLVAALRDLEECGDLSALANTLSSLAEMAHALGDGALGARLFGASKGVMESIGTTHAADQIEDYERVLGLVRETLGREQFEAAWRAGKEAPIDQIVREAAQLEQRAAANPRSPEEIALEQRTGLTARELSIVRLFAAGKSNQEIADALDLNLGFVTTLIGQIYTKLGVDSRAAVTAFAFKNGIA